MQTDLIEFERAYVTLEQLHMAFDEISNTQAQMISLEEYEEPLDMNPFLISMEEEREIYQSASALGGLSAARDGINTKLKQAMKDGVKDTAAGAAKGAIPLAKGIIKAARYILDKMAKLINAIGTATSKLLMTGFPLMGKIKARAIEIKEQAKSAQIVDSDTLTLKDAAKYLAIGNQIPSPDTIIRSLAHLNEIQAELLSKHKLSQFEALTQQTFEPYRDSIKTGKTDQLVFVLAVLALLTNPGVAIGAVFKKLFSAASPKLGASLDAAAKVGGGAIIGVGSLIPTMGSAGATYLKQLGHGKLPLGMLPRFAPLYPFCNTRTTAEDSGMYVYLRSETLLGNRQFIVKDFSDAITADQKGSVGRTGVKFTQHKTDVDDNTVKTLSTHEVEKICDLVVDILSNMQAYCKAWPGFYKSYNQAYTKISEIIMTYQPDDDDNRSLTAAYMRYSYRNAMNLMLGSIWNNCFGSDNEFIRYTLSLCRLLLTYCQRSISVTEPTTEDE